MLGILSMEFCQNIEFSTYQGLSVQVRKYLTGEIIVLVSSLLVKRDVM